MNSKLSDKDKKDWQNFVLSKNKVQNKDSKIIKNKNKKEVIKTIDLHGFSLDNANKVIEFNNIFPTVITPITLESTDVSAQPIMATVSFVFHDMKLATSV